MKILHIINSLYTGGAEKLLLDSIPRYIEKGIDTELLLLCGNKSPFFEQLESQEVIIHSISIGNINKIYNPFLIFKIMPYLKKYDIIHVHLFPSSYWCAIAKLLSLSKIKLIFTEHSTINKRMNKPFWYFFDSIIYKQYNKIVSIGEQIDLNLRKHLKKERTNKFCIINNGIDISKYDYDPLDRFKRNNDRKVIIQVSSFRQKKDQKTLIKAMTHLPTKTILQLVGDGVEREECEELVVSLKLTDRVFFLGVRTDISDLLSHADIAVLSSHVEGFGLVAVEAMAAGLPFIASDIPGLRDVVEGAGLLFPKGNDIILAEFINKLLSDDEFYYKTAQACYVRAKDYDISKMIDSYINIYKELSNE